MNFSDHSGIEVINQDEYDRLINKSVQFRHFPSLTQMKRNSNTSMN